MTAMRLGRRMFIVPIAQRNRFRMHQATRRTGDGAAALRSASIAASGPTEGVGLLFVDLDGFKVINDLRGHAVGDAVLAIAGGRLRGATRPGDVVGRLTSGESMSVGRDGASDAVSFLRAGVPAVEFGPTGSGHHGPEEWVSIRSLSDYRKTLVEFVNLLPARLGQDERPLKIA